MIEIDESETYKELALEYFRNPANFRTTNVSYEESLPKYCCLVERDSIGEWEGHCEGMGCYDDPDEAPFLKFYQPSWRKTDDCTCKLQLSDCNQAFSIALGDLRLWEELFSYSNNLSDDILLDEYDDTKDSPESNVPKPCQIQYLNIDFSRWTQCIYHKHGKCLSSAIASLLLALPRLKGLKISNLNSGDSSLFANFPSPRTLKDQSESFYPQINFISSNLETIYFHKSNIPSVDIFFLGDCIIENKVFPCLQNIKFYYCAGMTYSSILHLSPFVNLDFDRWECSGWTWPQDPVNPKNHSCHY